jgi:hypothetical protein
MVQRGSTCSGSLAASHIRSSFLKKKKGVYRKQEARLLKRLQNTDDRVRDDVRNTSCFLALLFCFLPSAQATVVCACHAPMHSVVYSLITALNESFVRRKERVASPAIGIDDLAWVQTTHTVILYPLFQNRIFLLGQQDILLLYSLLPHPSSFIFLLHHNWTRGTHSSFSHPPLFTLPPAPPTHSPRFLSLPKSHHATSSPSPKAGPTCPAGPLSLLRPANESTTPAADRAGEVAGAGSATAAPSSLLTVGCGGTKHEARADLHPCSSLPTDFPCLPRASCAASSSEDRAEAAWGGHRR